MFIVQLLRITCFFFEHLTVAVTGFKISYCYRSANFCLSTSKNLTHKRFQVPPTLLVVCLNVITKCISITFFYYAFVVCKKRAEALQVLL